MLIAGRLQFAVRSSQFAIRKGARALPHFVRPAGSLSAGYLRFASVPPRRANGARKVGADGLDSRALRKKQGVFRKRRGNAAA